MCCWIETTAAAAVGAGLVLLNRDHHTSTTAAVGAGQVALDRDHATETTHATSSCYWCLTGAAE